MHYYKKNIGDYAKKAGRLSMLQHGAYSQLIDSCYDREKFPTMEEAIDWVWASNKEEVDAVEFVLKKFFTLEDGIYVQLRIKTELDKYHETAATNKRIANEREANRRQKATEGVRSVNEAPPNHEPLTTNHEPLTKEKKKASRFTPPTTSEVNAYALDKSLNLVGFHDYYSSNGWKVSKNSMKDWKASARGWSGRQFGNSTNQQPPRKPRKFGEDR